MGALLQGVREGNAEAVRTIFADLHAEGHIVPAAQTNFGDEVAPQDFEEIDTEINLADEDAAALEGWDTKPDEQPTAAFPLGAAHSDGEESVVMDSGFEILIDGGECHFQIPSWAG